MLIKRTKRLRRIKPRWLARMYRTSLDDMEKLVNGEEVDIEEKRARMLVGRRLAVKVDETVPEPPKEAAGSDDSEPLSVEATEEKPSEKAEEKTPEVPKKKASKKKKQFDGAGYFTKEYPRYTIPDKDKGTKPGKDKEEDL
jgi:ribosomal protein L12E/L44/L45/RPP1/RPP2